MASRRFEDCNFVSVEHSIVVDVFNQVPSSVDTRVLGVVTRTMGSQRVGRVCHTLCWLRLEDEDGCAFIAVAEVDAMDAVTEAVNLNW